MRGHGVRIYKVVTHADTGLRLVIDGEGGIAHAEIVDEARGRILRSVVPRDMYQAIIVELAALMSNEELLDLMLSLAERLAGAAEARAKALEAQAECLEELARELGEKKTIDKVIEPGVCRSEMLEGVKGCKIRVFKSGRIHIVCSKSTAAEELAERARRLAREAETYKRLADALRAVKIGPQKTLTELLHEMIKKDR